MKKVILIGLLVLIFGTLAYVGGSTFTFSDGSRAGYLVKVSKKGVLFKTFEGQLNLGGFGGGLSEGGEEVDPAMPNNIWAFSVTDEATYQQLEEHQGERVRLRYKQKFYHMWWQGDTDYYVYEVEKVNTED